MCSILTLAKTKSTFSKGWEWKGSRICKQMSRSYKIKTILSRRSHDNALCLMNFMLLSSQFFWISQNCVCQLISTLLQTFSSKSIRPSTWSNYFWSVYKEHLNWISSCLHPAWNSNKSGLFLHLLRDEFGTQFKAGAILWSSMTFIALEASNRLWNHSNQHRTLWWSLFNW